MSESKTATSSGIGFVGLLTIAFIVLKLCNVIHWSWWFVISPIWITAAFVILMFIILSIIWFIMNKSKQEKYKAYLNEVKNRNNI